MAWIVENIQIPVPVGDCSFHILLRDGQIENAFIMDGGRKAKQRSARDAIYNALDYTKKYLSENYPFIKSDNLRFDSWVVTHWDTDHFLGVIELMENQIRENDKTLTRIFKPKGERRLLCGANPPKKYSRALKNVFGERILCGRDLIGYDLFSGEYLFNGSGELYRRWEVITELNRPRFCVFGANDFGVGPNGNVVTADRKGKAPSPNQTSILAILYWPAKGATEGGNCSYFCGGDGNPEIELKSVLPFINPQEIRTIAGGGFGPFLGRGLDIMKLDHHGSSGENLFSKTDEVYIDKLPIKGFMPRNILVTPGSEYGHPTYDVLILVRHMLELFTGVHKNQNADAGGRNKHTEGRLFSTRSPYWSSPKLLNNGQLNPQHLPLLIDLFENITGKSPSKTLTSITQAIPNRFDINYAYPEDDRESDGDFEEADFLVEMVGNAVDLNTTEKKIKAWRKRLREARARIAQKENAIPGEKPRRGRPRKRPLAPAFVQDSKNGHRQIGYSKELDHQPNTEEEEFLAMNETVLQALQFAGRVVWKESCDQPLIDESDETASPFFIIHFRFIDAVLEDPKWLDEMGEEKVAETLPTIEESLIETRSKLREQWIAADDNGRLADFVDAKLVKLPEEEPQQPLAVFSGSTGLAVPAGSYFSPNAQALAFQFKTAERLSPVFPMDTNQKFPFGAQPGNGILALSAGHNNGQPQAAISLSPLGDFDGLKDLKITKTMLKKPRSLTVEGWLKELDKVRARWIYHPANNDGKEKKGPGRPKKNPDGPGELREVQKAITELIDEFPDTIFEMGDMSPDELNKCLEDVIKYMGPEKGTSKPFRSRQQEFPGLNGEPRAEISDEYGEESEDEGDEEDEDDEDEDGYNSGDKTVLTKRSAATKTKDKKTKKKLLEDTALTNLVNPNHGMVGKKSVTKYAQVDEREPESKKGTRTGKKK